MKLQKIEINYVGDKGKKQIHSKYFLNFNPDTECLVIDWTNKEVDVYGKKKHQRHENINKTI